MFTASCHCGAVTLEIKRKPRKLTACNCSICRRYGAIWAYFRRKNVRVICVEKALEQYSWKNGTLEFFRCANCGCVTHHERSKKRTDGTDTLAVNMRNIDNPAVVSELPIRLLDGALTWKVLKEEVRPELWQSPHEE